MQPILFVSHGGGPMPLLGDPSHASLVSSFMDIRKKLTTPDTVIVFSAHWEAPSFTVSFNPTPGMLYDYYGFPPESYNIKYPAPGSPDIAQQAFELLKNAGLNVVKERQRGFDHGTFVPMKLLFPEANIPIVPISLNENLSSTEHIALGKALQPLREKNVLFLGSGLQFHNLPLMFQNDPAVKKAKVDPFTHWLDQTLTSKTLSETERAASLSQWEEMPNARLNHPREEHLIPLHACYGVAGKPVNEVFESVLMDAPARCYLWQ